MQLHPHSRTLMAYLIFALTTCWQSYKAQRYCRANKSVPSIRFYQTDYLRPVMLFNIDDQIKLTLVLIENSKTRLKRIANKFCITAKCVWFSQDVIKMLKIWHSWFFTYLWRWIENLHWSVWVWSFWMYLGIKLKNKITFIRIFDMILQR